MKKMLKQNLYLELLSIESELAQRGHTVKTPRETLVSMAADIGEKLRAQPYSTGESVAGQMGLDKNELIIPYKMLQRSQEYQAYFKESSNRDYFKVVKHYFDQDFFTLVFFVGISCPARCVFCPNVKIDKTGRRQLVIYRGDKESKLTMQTLTRVFEDIAKMKNAGTDILVKVSGGLEPLTDLPTTGTVIRLAGEKEIPVKLFTNGLLLTDAAKRGVALGSGDIRISLSTADEKTYQEICFSKNMRRTGVYSLDKLKDNIRQLVKERPAIHPDCKIGFNCLVLPENHRELLALIELASELGIDYIDFKPDYFSHYDAATVSAMEASIDEARSVVSRIRRNNLYVNFAGSLSRDDLFWRPWHGTCNALRQSDFKLFVSPFGHCCPVHYGAFPHSSQAFEHSLSQYSIGTFTPDHGLLDVLSNPVRTPEIELKKLNPFELMLHLETNRADQDEAWGVPRSVSPYHSRYRTEMPVELLAAFDGWKERSLA